MSLAIVLQYLTDIFDGAVERARSTGLVKWGFYMDHFLDFVFQCVLIIGYALIAPPSQNLDWWFFGILAITSGYMVNSFLCFAATNEFEIYFFGIGPTEIRIYFLALNCTIILLDPTRAYFLICVPIYTGLLAVGLFVSCLEIPHQIVGHRHGRKKQILRCKEVRAPVMPATSRSRPKL